ncbi:hypothetical protein CTDIVETGP_2155 [Clostridium tyrobutyricum DIVETGP]|uniref:Uncharacterized protein n=1 Tax=Clostridium tyrobutyricum DIVETGP TaxID=1408889 RepID=W6N744_CLOTY|nr:hypothetical protein CTK_C03790 [Clostridium tyrobutyricum]CDL92085.1 hypothetical protein CTDIVETGP_2155 [Clostridium tyrobutyricum DIVETGP]
MNFSSINPIPKKQANASEISKNIVIIAVLNTIDLFFDIAVLITYKFCNPMGAT